MFLIVIEHGSDEDTLNMRPTRQTFPFQILTLFIWLILDP